MSDPSQELQAKAHPPPVLPPTVVVVIFQAPLGSRSHGKNWGTQEESCWSAVSTVTA